MPIRSVTPRHERSASRYTSGPRADTLADVLERVLDRGVVIAGDVVVNVLDIELLTLKLRLVVASIDTAANMGIDWWTRDPFLNSRAHQHELETENRALRERLDALERRMDGVLEDEAQACDDGAPGARRLPRGGPD
jgi:hypothetical protein